MSDFISSLACEARRSSAALRRTLAVAATGVLVACGSSAPPQVAAPKPETGLSKLAECVLNSPRRAMGEGLDASGRLEVDRPAATPAAGACRDNNAYRYGSGLYDITGVVANTNGMGWENPQQVFSGLHTRLHARAFAIESPCNGRRAAFVSADVGILWSSLRQGVLDRIAADPELKDLYGPDNVMLSATHTHSGPAGYDHSDGGNLFHYGYDDDTWQVTVEGMYQAIRLAQANLQAHPQPAPIRLATGELLNTNLNRSKPAFALNPEAERAEFSNARGEEVRTNKRVVQLNFVRANGSPVGVINWFGVHPTVVGPTTSLVSSDNKGYASIGFERIMGTDYGATPGPDRFVAAFAQADEGDSSPNIRIEEFPHPDPRRGGGVDDYDSNAISGTKQLARALELFDEGAPLSGPVDYRFFYIPIDNITVTDPVVLASLRHPPELDAEVKRTCSGALGASFGAGAEDGPGPSKEGARCDANPDLLATVASDLDVWMSTTLAGFPGGWPQDSIPPYTVSAAVMCNRSMLPFEGDFSCQAEKPVFLASGPGLLPLQLFRIGNFALLGMPWEVTTMSARRIRKLLYEELAPAGIDTIVVAGLVNDYVNYLTTREEYSSQQYEGASTLYGPWSQAVVAQESLKLARALREGAPAPDGPQPARSSSSVPRPPYNPSDAPGAGGLPGALVSDVPATAAPGDTVRAEFQAGHPRNDLKVQSSYVFAERRTGTGDWEVVASDRDPELIFLWKPLNPSPLPIDPAVIGPSTAEALWTIPRNTPAGVYRLRHEGAWQPAEAAALEAYSGVSGEFEIVGPVGDCP